MNRSTWKQIERDWAEWLGGKRVPVNGRQRGSAPDVEHPLYAIEVKAGKTMPTRLRDGMQQAVASSIGTGKIPLLCVSHSRGRGIPIAHYVIMRLEDFQQWNGGGDGEDKGS